MSGVTDSIPIEMPQLSAGQDEDASEGATLASWLVAVGDLVKQGEVVAELETDKATVELESPVAGRVLELVVAEGTEGVVPGTVLGLLASGGASVNASAGSGDGAAPASASVSADRDSGASAEPATPANTAREYSGSVGENADAPRSTPLARRAAVANEVDLAELAGTGAGGRVVEADVLQAAGQSEGSSAGAASEEQRASAPVDSIVSAAPVVASIDESVALEEGVRSERLSAMRKTIARRMTESKQQVPHFYLRMRVRMDEVMSVRARLNEGLAAEGRDVKISVNDFVIRALALGLRDVPAANVQYAGDAMHVFDRVDVSVAVATDGGLVTPVIRDADRKGLTSLAEEVKFLAGLARDGKLKPEQYQGGTATISNLGMYGIESVYPIINPPQACILGVGAAEEQAVVVDGELQVGRVASLTLAADHRAVDGAVGAQLLASVCARLIDPLGMML
jgi:pyruvate dehydrogenase E2 component (dihydrolipoamide acetyltransferase)